MNRGLRFYIVFQLLFCLGLTVSGQELHKHFEFKESKGLDKIDLSVSTKAGKSFLNAVDDPAPVVILGASENNVAASTFQIEKRNQTQTVNADLTCKSHMGLNFTEAVASTLFPSSDAVQDLWQINLSDKIAFNLNLNYLMGEANIDLSRLAIERLKIKSGSANVKLSYSDQMMNSVAMDTFFVKVNFGSIEVNGLNYAMAKNIIAEVGFGSLFIDCGSDWKLNSHVNASVGAGNLDILLPPDDVPVVIRIQNSPLCNIKMAKNFEKIAKNAFANEAYNGNPDDSMEFILDVGMGSITFQNQKQNN